MRGCAVTVSQTRMLSIEKGFLLVAKHTSACTLYVLVDFTTRGHACFRVIPSFNSVQASEVPIPACLCRQPQVRLHYLYKNLCLAASTGPSKVSCARWDLTNAQTNAQRNHISVFSACGDLLEYSYTCSTCISSATRQATTSNSSVCGSSDQPLTNDCIIRP